MRVGVIGGSLGGLTAALVLTDLGHDVEVFERSRSGLSTLGAGIVSHPVTLRYLQQRLDVSVEELTTPSGRLRYLRRDESVAYDAPGSYRFIAWATLYGRLRDAFTGRLHLGANVVAVAHRPGGAAVRLGGRSEREFDLVVAADGIKSMARAALLPDARFSYAGYVGWRGTVPVATLSDRTLAVLRDYVTYYAEKRTQLLAYPIAGQPGSGERMLNYVWYRNVETTALPELLRDETGTVHALSVPPKLVSRSAIAALRREAGHDLPAAMAELVLKTAQPFFQVIGDVEIPRMRFGRIVLVGDAAFVARPHAAAGTAKAAADGWALAEALSATSSVDDALERWEASQLVLGSQLVHRARTMGRRSQETSDWEPGDAFFRFGLYGPGD